MSPSLAHAIPEIKKNYNSLNWWRNRVFVPHIVGPVTRLNPQWPSYQDAIHVMDEEWDNLIVLDACRADEFEKVANLDQFDSYERVVSLGSHSSEWTRRNFANDEFGDTVVVSANPHTAKVAGNSFHDIIPLWEVAFDDEEGTVLPEDVVEAALEASEKYPQKRLIVHFMQPHAPFVGTEITDIDDPENYWKAYRDTLEYGLSNAIDLAEELSGRTVFTADHGELNTGKILSTLGIDCHRPKLRHPGLVVVPWAVINGERRETSTDSVRSAESGVINDRLRDLGYKV
ncbi:hypothetical protein [Salinarchaeum sp. Harcht-Bsk1]|uniref:hypothetical protein n=1 Tax=Salinarchaeum sp. Harcht-Bsk1 TaxID=1333523 RepID=UPI0011817AC7|nr:hypothetical protein [Salinarchaeum sp. Harcht-Bsk1]